MQIALRADYPKAELGSSEFWVLFLTSPGVAGVGALLAASLAVLGVLLTTSSNRKIAKQARDARAREHAAEQWWKRAEWALNLLVGGKNDDVSLAVAILDAISEDEDGKSSLNIALGEYLQDRLVDITSGGSMAQEPSLVDGPRNDLA